MKLCSCCHQPLPEIRAGVRLSPLKAHIFDAIKRAGVDGIPLEVVNTLVFDGRTTAVNVRNHVHQINDALAGSGLQLSGQDPRGFYRIVREPQ
jgi:hypothetical protein